MRKLLLVSAMLICQQLFSQSIIYVNHAATGSNNGSSWADAYADLQDALEDAQAGDEIWVAQGWYYPSKGLLNDTSVAPRDRCFSMVDSVGIYGGFDGTETLRKQRDFRNNKTTLSADVGVLGDKTDNCRHVVHNDRKIYLTDKSVLDGFTIRDGYSLDATAPSWDRMGAGVFHNSNGGGVFKNLVIKQNSAGVAGGGIASIAEPTTFINCKVFNNYARYLGYGVYSSAGSLKNKKELYVNCFIGLNDGDTVITSHHAADFSGGVPARLIGCTFAVCGNGRAIGADLDDHLKIVNSIISDSIVLQGSLPTTSDISFKNSLVRYSGGSSNWSLANTIDLGGNIDTNAFLVTNGGFSLQAISPAIGAGLLDSIPLDKYDLDEDGITNESIPYDLDGNMRVADGTVDMGAYEFIPAWTDTLYQSVCVGDSSIFNGQYVKDEGVYKQSYAPDSALYFTMDVDTPNVGVEVWFGGILEAKADSVLYQWIDCNDTTNKLIATQKAFYPTKPGDYAVVLTAPNGCVDTSACYLASTIGQTEQPLKDEFYFYPNPVKDVLKIGFGEGQKVLNISIKNISGQSLLTKQVQLQGQPELELNVEALPAGIYFLEVKGRVKRFVKSE